jgi:PAS domain S-box-containing protein
MPQIRIDKKNQLDHATIHDLGNEFHIFSKRTDLPVMIYDGKQVKYVNPAAELLTGYSQQEILDTKFENLFSKSGKPAIRNLGKSMQSSGSHATHGEFSLLTKRGVELWVDLWVTKTEYEEKEAFICNAIDITKFKREKLFQEVLLRITNVAKHPDPIEAAQIIVDALENINGWQSRSIWLIDATIQKPTIIANSRMGIKNKAIQKESDKFNSMISDINQGIIGMVCSSGQAVNSGDVRSIPFFVDGNIGTLSELCVPVKVGEKTIGCINIESRIPNSFDEIDEQMVLTLANQFSIFWENSQLHEEIRQRSTQQEALNSIINASTRSGTYSGEILKETLEKIFYALDLDMGVIWLSWSSQGIQRIASQNLPQVIINSLMANVTFPSGTSQTSTLVVDDWNSIERKFSEQFVSLGINSTVIIPLVSNNQRIGGIALASQNVHYWTIEEIALLEVIGKQVGSAAERTKLFEETTFRLDELEAVNTVLTSLRLAQSLQELIPQLMEDTLKIIGVEAGGIWLFNAERNKLCQMIGRGWCTQTIHLELEREESLPGKVFSIGDIYFSQDVANDSLTSPAMRELVPLGWSAICLPIHSDQEPIGVLLASAPTPHEFTSENARLLVTLTEFAGIAIHRTRLNEKMMHHAAELELRVAERTAELQSALKKAQESDRLKSEFIINVNHELRTPLTNLVLYYQMLRAQPTIKTEERLDVIGRELQRLRNLIEELLNLSRFDLGQVALRPVKCDLNALVQTLVNDRRSLAEERGLSLNVKLKENLLPVWLDEPAIVQAVSNLLTNAMNYTPRGGIISVTTMSKYDENKTWIGFRIQDNGFGIDNKDMPHLFERFYRGKAGHESGAPGTGLGLAIVKQIMNQHQGKIDVDNVSRGRGAIFTIWLPGKNEAN